MNDPGPPVAPHRSTTLGFAVAAGILVANLYYAQPILDSIAGDLGTSASVTGLVVTATQVGYALGLLLAVPAGDVVAPRRLVPTMLALASLALLAAAAAPTIAAVAGALLVAGFGSAAAQVLVPLAAGLAAEGTRGAVVGRVMAGLLAGIVLARTISGVVADATDWRFVFVLGAVLTAVCALRLARTLSPASDPAASSYAAMLRSAVRLVRTQPELRRSALVGALCFASFNVFWTAMAFHLSARPFSYSDAAIGSVGLVGIVGALCASTAGRLADRRSTHAVRRGATLLVAAAFASFFGGRSEVLVLVAGVVLLEIGVQSAHVLNRSIVYELVPGARARINSAYMTTYFLGGALGSVVSSTVYDQHGWTGVCTVGCLLGLLATMVAAARRCGDDSVAGTASPAIGSEHGAVQAVEARATR